MKSNYFLFAILLFIFFSGCKSDFDLTAPYKEIPVVYGLLNKDETTHYLRIQKAFLIDGNAQVAAGVADSVFYTDSITVKMIGYTASGIRKDSFFLYKVDGNLLGLPKDSGLFASSPNILYAFNATLDANKSYRLEITRNGNSLARTSDDLNKNIFLIDHLRVGNPYSAAKFQLRNTNPSEMNWASQQNAGIYDLTVRFYYREYSTATNALLLDTYLDVPFFTSTLSDYVSGGTIKADFNADILLNALAKHLAPSPTVYRQFVKMDFTFAAGGNDLALFVKSKQGQSGITSGEALPAYSNIVNGAGILSSRVYTTVDSVLLAPLALDTLACSEISRALRFKNHNGVTCD